MLKAFQSALKKRPLPTQMAASGVISACGDCFTQFVIEKRSTKTYDLRRTSRFLLISSCVTLEIMLFNESDFFELLGMFFWQFGHIWGVIRIFWQEYAQAPIASRWFLLLEKVRGPTKLVPFYRVCLDQICMIPIINVVVLTALRVLEGYSFDTSVSMMKRDWWGVYSTSIKVWPIAQMVNFYLVPLALRVLFVQFVSLFWHSFVSFKTQKKLHDHELSENEIIDEDCMVGYH